MQLLIENKALVLGALFAVSELLAVIPAVKANSVFGLLHDVLMALVSKK